MEIEYIFCILIVMWWTMFMVYSIDKIIKSRKAYREAIHRLEVIDARIEGMDKIIAIYEPSCEAKSNYIVLLEKTEKTLGEENHYLRVQVKELCQSVEYWKNISMNVEIDI